MLLQEEWAINNDELTVTWQRSTILVQYETKLPDPMSLILHDGRSGLDCSASAGDTLLRNIDSIHVDWKLRKVISSCGYVIIRLLTAFMLIGSYGK